MKTIRVIAGHLKGKKIPFDNRKYDCADITTQKIKGAIFSILGENLNGKTFLDLFSASGQVGIEACSRGAESVIFNELDKKRYFFINELVSSFKIESDIKVFNFHSSHCIRYLRKNKIMIDYIFIDPPYEKKSKMGNIYTKIISEISKNDILQKDGTIIVQHFAKNKIEKKIEDFELKETKEYGNSSLSIFR